MTSPRDFFEKKLIPRVAQDANCLKSSGIRAKTIAVDIDGVQGGRWTLNFDGEGAVRLSADLAAGDCTISCSDKTFGGMIDGTVNVPMAFLMRKIKVKGDSGLAARIGLELRKLF